MTKQMIDDGAGWFDLDAASRYTETTYYDRRGNEISRATGDQWSSEELHRTKNNQWIIHWSSVRGAEDQWASVEDFDAASWLLRCGYEPPRCLAAVVAEMER